MNMNIPCDGIKNRTEEDEDFSYRLECKHCKAVLWSNANSQVRCAGDASGLHSPQPMQTYVVTSPQEELDLAFSMGGCETEEESNDCILLAWKLLGQPNRFDGHGEAEGLIFRHVSDRLVVEQGTEILFEISVQG